MKKLPVIFAVAAALSTSSALAEVAPADVQIFTKDFGVSVQKQSEVVVELPSDEVVELSMDDILPNADGVEPRALIGIMDVQTTATHCEATITTQNQFTLVGKYQNYPLAHYKIEYMSGSAAGIDDPTIQPITAFGMGMPETQPVGCNTAELFMTNLEIMDGAPSDAYEDVINVTVRAES